MRCNCPMPFVACFCFPTTHVLGPVPTLTALPCSTPFQLHLVSQSGPALGPSSNHRQKCNAQHSIQLFQLSFGTNLPASVSENGVPLNPLVSLSLSLSVIIFASSYLSVSDWVKLRHCHVEGYKKSWSNAAICQTIPPPSRIVGPKPLWQGLCVAAPGSLRNDLGPRRRRSARRNSNGGSMWQLGSSQLRLTGLLTSTCLDSYVLLPTKNE